MKDNDDGPWGDGDWRVEVTCRDFSTPMQGGHLTLGRQRARSIVIICASLLLALSGACAHGPAAGPAATNQSTQPPRPEPTTLASPTAVPGTGTLADPAGRLSPQDQAGIRQLIGSYFDARYRSFQMLALQNLEGFTAGTPESEAFLKLEEAKLMVELRRAEDCGLGYARYSYTLDYNDVSVDVASQRATVSLDEGHDVVYEADQRLFPDNPMVAKLRNVAHTLVLEKMDGSWKIVSDTYEDYVWRVIKALDLTTAELIISTMKTDVCGGTSTPNP